MTLRLEHWRIFVAGIRFGQAAPVRLTQEEAEECIKNLGISQAEIEAWRAQEKEDWRRH